MAKVKRSIDCAVYKVKSEGIGIKRYFAKFPATRGTVLNHDRTDDAIVFSVSSFKMLTINKNGEAKKVRKKIFSSFAVKYDILGDETPFELQGKIVSFSPNKIVIE